MNTMLSIGMPEEEECYAKNAKESAWFSWVAKAVVNGTFKPTLRNAGVGIVGPMKLLQGFERRDTSEAFFRAYSEPFALPEECDGVIAFPKSLVIKTFTAEQGSSEDQAAVRAKPAMTIYGTRDKVSLAKCFVPVFQAAYPSALIHYLDNASHFLQEDAPEEISQLILEFMKSD
jgi:pimeloyl-ACP methyl ester carboxylesterase